MKPYLYLFALLLVLGTVQAAVPDAPTLSVDLLRYEPTPAKPGDTITAWLQLTNEGGRAAQNVVIEVPGSYPFTPASAADRTITVGTLASQSQYVTKVRLAIDRSASEGSFELPVTIRADTTSVRYNLNIDIDAAATSVAVQSVRTTPEEIVPGEKATVQVTVENVEQGLVRDLSLSLDLADSVFAPLGSSTQQKVTSLNGGEEHTFTFTLVAQPDAASSIYKLPLQLNFTTAAGERRGQTETIGLLVHAKPELSIVVDEAEIYEGSDEGTVLLRLVNKGLSEIKFVEATIQEGEGYELRGNARTLYVGNIDSDDFETIEYDIKPLEEEFSVNVELRYRDSLNNAYAHTTQVPLRTTEQPSEGPSAWMFLLLALVVIGGIVWWRRSRRTRR